MDYEALLLNTLSKGQIEEAIAEKISAFHGLLTRDVALRLVAKEKGLVNEEEKRVEISVLKDGERKTIVEARIKKIWPVAEYKSGKKSRVVEIEDNTGSIPLVLWNDDVDLANRLRSKDSIRVKGAYKRNNELHLGYTGNLELLSRQPFTDLTSMENGEFVHVSGFVSRIEGLDRYVSGSSARLGFSFFISDGSHEVRVIIWGNPDRGKGLKQGDEVIIEGALVSDERLELSEDARIMARKKEKMLLGKIESMELDGDLLKVRVSGKETELDRPSALKLMAINVNDDILLSTALTLKKSYLLNTNVSARTRLENGRTIIE